MKSILLFVFAAFLLTAILDEFRFLVTAAF